MENGDKCWICGGQATGSYEHHMAKEHITQKQLDRFKEIDGSMPKLISKVGKHLPTDAKPRMYCDKCFEAERNKITKQREEYARLKKTLMFERAIRLMESQGINLYDYYDIILDMQEYVKNNPSKFDSSHEMVAAMILIDNEIKSKMQFNVSKYKVDFLLPSLKVALEIDGGLHKNTLYKDNQRDIEIRRVLGRDWEIVRISTEYIEQNAEMLIEAIHKVKAEKVRLRKENCGMLPEWYSKRNKAQRTRSIKQGDDKLLGL